MNLSDFFLTTIIASIILGIFFAPILLAKKQIKAWKLLFMLICLISLLFVCSSPIYPTRSRASARQKACFSNIRVLMGAIEMYNMDHSEMITDFTEESMDYLIKEGYLKTKITGPNNECKYKSIGNLNEFDNEQGIVYCVYHGDIHNILQCKYSEDDKRDKLSTNCSIKDYNKIKEEIVKGKARKDIKENDLPIFLIVIIILLYISCFFDKSKEETDKPNDYK